MVCNPNSSSATLTATIVDKSGNKVTSQAFQLSANGSSDISISSMTGGDVRGYGTLMYKPEDSFTSSQDQISLGFAQK